LASSQTVDDVQALPGDAQLPLQPSAEVEQQRSPWAANAPASSCRM